MVWLNKPRSLQFTGMNLHFSKSSLASIKPKSVRENLMDNQGIEHVSFEVNGLRLQGRKYGTDLFDEEPLPIVIYLHGYGTSRRSFWELARRFVGQNIMAFAFDFRGCGKSQGRTRTQTIADAFVDVLTAYDLVASWADVDSERIGVLGSSLGGYLASMLSAERSVKSLALSAPAIYADDWSGRIIAKIPEEELLSFRREGDLVNTRAMKAIAAFTGSLLVIRHGHDEQVPARVPETYKDLAEKAVRRDLHVIRSACHGHSPKTRRISDDLCLDWFTRELSA